MKTEQKKRDNSPATMITGKKTKTNYEIYTFKLTVKYETIYTQFYKVVKAKKLFATSP